MSELNVLADVLERFSDVGVIGYSLLIFGLIITGWLYTRMQVNEIRAGYEDRIKRMEKVLDDFYAEERRAAASRRRRPS